MHEDHMLVGFEISLNVEYTHAFTIRYLVSQRLLDVLEQQHAIFKQHGIEICSFLPIVSLHILYMLFYVVSEHLTEFISTNTDLFRNLYL